MIREDALAEAGNVKKRAFRDIQKLSRSFLGLLLIADDLAEIGDLEEAAAKAKAELAAAEKELADRRAEIEQTKLLFGSTDASLRAVLADRRAELRTAELAVKDAEDRAAAKITEADADATKRIEAAQMEALTIIGVARDSAAEVVREGERKAKEREDEADRLVAERRGTLAELDRDITDRQAALDEINAVIARHAAA